MTIFSGIRQVYLGFNNLECGTQQNTLNKLPGTFLPLKPGEIHRLTDIRYIKPFKTIHRVPSQG